MKFPTQFETERLILRATSEIDADFILELLNSPKWLANIGDRKVRTKEDAIKYIHERIMPDQIKIGYSNFTVIKKEGEIKIGSCGLYNREGIDGVDIGFAFLPQYERKGYAFESAEKIKNVGLDIFGIKKISAITLPSNQSSRKLLEKLGLTFEKMIRIPNDEEELMLYVLEV